MQVRVQHIPEEWFEQIRPLVEQGRGLKYAIAEVFAATAQLLARCVSSPEPRGARKKA